MSDPIQSCPVHEVLTLRTRRRAVYAGAMYRHDAKRRRVFFVCESRYTGLNPRCGMEVRATSAREAAKTACEHWAFEDGHRELHPFVFNENMRPRGAFRWSNFTEKLQDGTIARVQRHGIREAIAAARRRIGR